MRWFCLMGAALLLAACDSTATQPAGDDLVVEAFLFTEEPVNNIRITEAIPLSETSESDSLETPVNDAVVTLFKEGVPFRLKASGTDGFYHYDGDDLAVEEGDTFRLTVERGNTSIQAETTVPERPEGVALSSDRVEIVRIVIGPGGLQTPGGESRVRESLQRASIRVGWENSRRDLHFVVVNSLVGENPRYILPEFIRVRFEPFRLVTEPTDDSAFDVNLRTLEVFGAHQAVVYRVNKEYADLYAGREQDSRDLNEPPSNIEGGLGVFSAFAGVAMPFAVVPVE
ncbi:MAG: DUF4249 family protein [Rhodothermales bacterium]|nr:DUF4249 family protein [Rhodothermales bacterium]MBO6778072.1 DUF4249 family protein [Rhodothermales bacterium]